MMTRQERRTSEAQWISSARVSPVPVRAPAANTPAPRSRDLPGERLFYAMLPALLVAASAILYCSAMSQ